MPMFEPGVKFPSWNYVQPGIAPLEDFANNIGIGKAGKWNKRLMGQMIGGDYGELAGTLLSPIHDRFAADTREAVRANSMGGNAFVQGSQPALMANIEQDTRRKMAEGEGMAYGSAIPQMWGQATQGYQNALNQQEQAELAAREAALRGRIAGSTPMQTPSTWDKIMGVVGGVGKIASMI